MSRAAMPGERLGEVGRPPRLGWLDALRGLAVLLVLYEHLTWHVLGVLRSYTQAWFDAGRAGVFLFFVISGYIVPATLERHGSLRRFWINRIFRLYPLIVVGTAAAVVLAVAGAAPLDPVAVKQTWATAIASATMLQDLLSLPSTPAVLWSLSYEMIFYLLLSALFVFGLHTRSAECALAFAGTAFALGGVLPAVTLSAMGVGKLSSAVLVLIAVVLGLLGLMSGRRAPVVAGAVAVGALAVALLASSERFPAWYTMSIPAAMFAGTAVYRAEHGQISWRRAGYVAAVVFSGTAAAVWWALPDARWQTVRTTGHWVGSLALAGAIFAVGMSLRGRRFPTPLVKLGLISYSVYVLHYVLVLALDRALDPYHDAALVVQVLVATGFVGLVVGLSALSYRFVERPMQAAGRRLGRLIDHRLGADPPALPAQRTAQPMAPVS